MKKINYITILQPIIEDSLSIDGITEDEVLLAMEAVAKIAHNNAIEDAAEAQRKIYSELGYTNTGKRIESEILKLKI